MSFYLIDITLCTLLKHSTTYHVILCLQIIFGEGGDDTEEGPSFFGQAVGIFKSINRFMKVISK